MKSSMSQLAAVPQAERTRWACALLRKKRVLTTPGVSYSATCAGPNVNAPSRAASVVLVLLDTADTCRHMPQGT